LNGEQICPPATKSKTSIVPKVKKKVHSGKSCFFPQCAIFQELPSFLSIASKFFALDGGEG